MPNFARTFRCAIPILVSGAIVAIFITAARCRALADTKTKPNDIIDIQDVDPSIQVEMMYADSNNFTGRIVKGYFANTCYLTSSAAKALFRAKARLKEEGRKLNRNYSLLVKDCYRPQKAVQDFVAWAADPLDVSQQATFYPDLMKSELIEKNYISPISGHSRASSVDLTIVEVSTNGETSKFIYVGEDGTISAWSSGVAALMVADRSTSNAVYKGVAIAKDGVNNFLYVANFKGNNIDVFDKSFNLVTTKTFDDPTIPAGFAPFNIYTHNNQLYVSYAKLKAPANVDDESGAGNGYVSVFNPDGSFVKRFASQGTLNSPWAIADAPSGFGLGDNRILVGNFGDGRINVFDQNGNYEGQLKNDGTTISIEGLWALSFPENDLTAGGKNRLFFTAGPNAENNGLFGYLNLR